MIVPGMLVCSSLLIGVCMFIVSKPLLISSATMIVRAGGAIWLNPFATVLFTVCSRYCRVLSFVPMLRGCVRYVCGYFPESAKRSQSIPPVLCSKNPVTFPPLPPSIVKIAAPWLDPPQVTLRADQKWPQITREPSSQTYINNKTIIYHIFVNGSKYVDENRLQPNHPLPSN